MKGASGALAEAGAGTGAAGLKGIDGVLGIDGVDGMEGVDGIDGTIGFEAGMGGWPGAGVRIKGDGIFAICDGPFGIAGEPLPPFEGAGVFMRGVMGVMGDGGAGVVARWANDKGGATGILIGSEGGGVLRKKCVVAGLVGLLTRVCERETSFPPVPKGPETSGGAVTVLCD